MTDFISVAISGGALVISVLIYLRQRSLENENFFFQFKIQEYSQVITCISELLELMHRNYLDLIDELKQSYPGDEELAEIIGELDDKMRELRVVLHRTCAFIPKEIVEKLDALYDRIFHAQIVLEKDDFKTKELENELNTIDKLEDDLEVVINLMRKDLGTDAIDLRLKRRTRQ